MKNYLVDERIVNDIKASLENKKEEKKINIKLTPAQKRNAIYLQIEEALSEKDFDEVENILILNPDTEFTSKTLNLESLEKKIIENFDFKTVMMFQDRGLVFNSSVLIEQFEIVKKNKEMLDFLLNHYKSDEASVEKAKRATMMTISDLYLKSTPENQKSKFLFYKKEIDKNKNTRSLFSEELSNSWIVQRLIRDVDGEFIEDVKNDFNLIEPNKLKKEMANIIYHDLESDPWSKSEFISFLTMYENFDFVREIVSSFFKKIDILKEKPYSYEKFIEDYVDTKNENGKSKIFDVGGRIHTVKVFFQQINNLAWMEDERYLNLGLNNREMFTIHGKINFYANPNENKSEISHIMESYQNHKYNDMDEVLIASGKDIIESYLESDRGREIILNKLTSSIKVRTDFCRKVTPAILNKVIKNVDKLKEWKDDKGNNLGHYLISFGPGIASLPKTIARHAHEWFYDKNNKGFDLIELMKKGKYTTNQIVLIERDILKRSLRSEGVNKRGKAKRHKKVM